MGNAEEKRVVLGSMTGGGGGQPDGSPHGRLCFRSRRHYQPSHAWLVHIIIYTATAASRGRCEYDVHRVRTRGTQKLTKAFEVAWTYQLYGSEAKTELEREHFRRRRRWQREGRRG